MPLKVREMTDPTVGGESDEIVKVHSSKADMVEVNDDWTLPASIPLVERRLRSASMQPSPEVCVASSLCT